MLANDPGPASLGMSPASATNWRDRLQIASVNASGLVVVVLGCAVVVVVVVEEVCAVVSMGRLSIQVQTATITTTMPATVTMPRRSAGRFMSGPVRATLSTAEISA